jgi:hypothetical protein
MDAGKPGKRAAWGLDAADVLAKIELGYLVSLTAASICYVNGYLYGFATAGRWRLHSQVIVAEPGVTEAEAEGKERLAIVIDILMDA